MKSILAELKCIRCAYLTHKKSETLVFADFDEHSRIALRENSFFMHYCPQCHHVHQFFHSLLYIDKNHDFALWISNSKDISEDINDVLTWNNRYVINSKLAAEKIRIFEDGLNDQVIEHWKSDYAKNDCSITNIIYQDISEKLAYFEVVRDYGNELVAIEVEKIQVKDNNTSKEFLHINYFGRKE